MTDYKKIIASAIALEGVSEDEIYSSIAVPQDSAMGEYCLPCFKFAKALRLSPIAIAEKIKAEFKASDAIKEINVVNGYVNFKLSREFFVREQIAMLVDKGDEFAPKMSNNKSICIDYSSINIAKPFHIGHLLTTAIGGSLYKIYKYLGYDVIGINHLGDWGTQFGKLISAYKRWGSDEDINTRGVMALNEIYVKFHAEAEKDPSLDQEGRDYFKQIEDGDEEALRIFNWFKDITLAEVKKIYEQLNISFDSYNGESFYNDKMDAVIDILKEKDLLTTSNGASVVDLEKEKMPPCLILKSDGATLYATRDLAAAMYRKKEYDFHKNLYVVAYQQNLHFKQVFAVLNKMGFEWSSDCAHVPFGMVSLENMGALSTRKGNVVYLKDVLDTAVKKTEEIIENKNPNLENKAEIAKTVGTGAVLFMALSNSRIKDIVFSYDKALNFDGETSPYIQYTHARCNSILQKASDNTISANQEINFADLVDDESFELIKLLSNYDSIVESAGEKYEPSVISRYLIDVSQSFNRYYISHKILGDNTREMIAKLVRNVLKNGLALLLIGAPERM